MNFVLGQKLAKIVGLNVEFGRQLFDFFQVGDLSVQSPFGLSIFSELSLNFPTPIRKYDNQLMKIISISLQPFLISDGIAEKFYLNGGNVSSAFDEFTQFCSSSECRSLSCQT